MTDIRRDQLAARMFVCTYIVRELLAIIRTLEADPEVPSNAERFSQIKKIREEMTKVGTEIDSIKKELILLKPYDVN
jgi:hypothetical protein